MDAQTTFQRWQEVRDGLMSALDLLQDSQLDFKPHPGLWSVRETVVHLAGTEEGWLRWYTANKWHPGLADLGQFPSVASLKKLLVDIHQQTLAQFGDDPAAVLAQECLLPWGAQVNMEWAVWHVLEHEIHHRGEIYLMLGLLGMEAPDV